MYVYVAHTTEILCPTCGELVARKSLPNRPSMSQVVRNDKTPLIIAGGRKPLPQTFQVKCERGCAFPLVAGQNCEVVPFASDPQIGGGLEVTVIPGD